MPELLELLVIFVALTIYALFAGADFGAGVWEVNTALLASERERKLLFRAIGPVWEANHVWLIFVLVSMFGAFPLAFSALCQALWLPLSLALAGIVFRGVGFAFRSYMQGSLRHQYTWSAVFAIGSAAAPFFLGACVGAVWSGKLAISADGHYEGDYLIGWISPMALFSAFFSVGICTYLSAVYLAREARQTGEADLVQLWRQRALASGIWMGVLALTGMAYMSTDTFLWEGFSRRSWPLVGGSVAAGFLSLYALAIERYLAAAVCAATAVASVIWGWGFAQYPLLVPPSITVDAAKAPTNVLWLLLATSALGAVFLLPALAYLLYLFKSDRAKL